MSKTQQILDALKLESANIKDISYLPVNLNLTIEDCSSLMDDGLPPQTLLEIALKVSLPPTIKMLDLVNLVISRGAELAQPNLYIDHRISIADFSALVALGLNPTNHLRNALYAALAHEQTYQVTEGMPSLSPSTLFWFELLNSVDHKKIDLVSLFVSTMLHFQVSLEKAECIIKPLLQLPFDINEAFEGLIESRSFIGSVEQVISCEMFEFVNSIKPIKPELLLEYGINKKATNIVQLAIGRGADVNAKTHDGESSMLELALQNSKDGCVIIDLLLERALKTISLQVYICAISISSIPNAAEIIKRFPDIYNEQDLYELLRSYGQSHATIRAINDMHKLSIDYLDGSLSKAEMQMLCPEPTLLGAASFETSNSYGYSTLHLALLAHKYELAIELIKSGADIYAKTQSGVTPLQIISNVELGYEYRELQEKLLSATYPKVVDVDCDVNDAGETIADRLLGSEFRGQVLVRTKDPLFDLMKAGVGLDIPKDGNVHIAISNSDGFWSQGMWSTARLIMKKHPEVKFHLVEKSMLETGGAAFLSQFDAVINPGGSDNYPKDKPEFSKEQCMFDSNLEKMWQQVADMSYNLGIPYLGICAGAQHLALYHDGTLMPLEGYVRGKHEIRLVKGTPPYFLAMTQKEREVALSSGVFPDITFKGDTAHHYAAKQLAGGLVVGGVSEDGVNMAYGHQNGIRFATQFHPEHYYGEDPHQTAWFENFIALAIGHHEARSNSSIDFCAQEKELALEFIAGEFVNSILGNVVAEFVFDAEQG